jgi:succinoglycan biosynthesis protein ExoO
MHRQYRLKLEDMRKGVTPRVSVIVPAFNVAGCLERALNSALDQTIRDLEILVVDDGSSDATLEVACRVAALDSRVRVLRNERNLGIGASRNRAFDEAEGEWLALLDGDDVWLPMRLERMLAASEHADVVSDDVYVMRGLASKLREPVFCSFLQLRGLNLTEPHRLSVLELARHDIALIQPMFRRSFLVRHRLRYDPALRINEDFRFYLEILALEPRWLQLPQGYYLYFTDRVGSVCSDPRLQYQDLIKATQALFNHPAVAGDAALTEALERRIQEARSIMVFETVRDVLRRYRFGEGTRLLFEKPYYLRAVAVFLLRAFVRRVRMKRRRLSELEAEA